MRRGALARLAFGQAIDRKAKVRVLIKQQIFRAAVSGNAIRPFFRGFDQFGIGQ